MFKQHEYSVQAARVQCSSSTSTVFKQHEYSVQAARVQCSSSCAPSTVWYNVVHSRSTRSTDMPVCDFVLVPVLRKRCRNSCMPCTMWHLHSPLRLCKNEMRGFRDQPFRSQRWARFHCTIDLSQRANMCS